MWTIFRGIIHIDQELAIARADLHVAPRIEDFHQVDAGEFLQFFDQGARAEWSGASQRPHTHTPCTGRPNSSSGLTSGPPPKCERGKCRLRLGDPRFIYSLTRICLDKTILFEAYSDSP
jgi:hypothetical protein